jgi:L(+)-tartrate dehydratase alpha subunit
MRNVFLSAGFRDIVELVDILIQLIGETSVFLPDDVISELERARNEETQSRAKRIYDVMFENLELAAERRAPICQDTGIPEFFIRAGEDFPHIGMIEREIRRATVEATKRIPLRPNAVEDDRNTGDNTGERIPWIDWEIIPEREDAEITLYLAGGGSSLPGAAKVIPPHSESIEDIITDRIARYGANACPPLIVGVGLGATAEMAAILSKKALLRPIGTRTEEEDSMMKRLNALNIGPQGLGGRTTVLDVKIERSARHPATLAVGLSTGCWVHRRGTVHINADMSFEIISHRRLR